MSAIIASAAALFAAVGAAPDINAPIDTRPTLASEMRRGWEAADGCPITLDPLERSLCVVRVEDGERKRNGFADPFILGAELREWFTADLQVQADLDLPGNPAAQAQLPGAREECAGAALVASGLQKKLGLTDGQLFAGAALNNVEAVQARWTWWRAQPLERIAYPGRP